MADTLQTITCPACGKEMKKILMMPENVHLDVCLDGCGGIFFDNREYQKFDEKAEDIDEILEATKGKVFQKVDTSTTKICPTCGAKMVKHFASSKHEVEIDECYMCGGKFLDNGELQKIRAQFATEEERAQAAVKELHGAVGSKLDALDSEWQAAISRRSPMHSFLINIMSN